MTHRARVRVVIEYDTNLGDPDGYEGETTAEGKAAKEAEYIRDDGDYLFQALGALPHKLDVDVHVLAPGTPPLTGLSRPV